MGNLGCLPLWKGDAANSHATQPTVHTACFGVSIIHQTLTWTTGSLMCIQMLMHAIAHGGVRTHVREPALKVEFGRKIPCCTGELNLRWWCDGPKLYQLSYIPTLACEESAITTTTPPPPPQH